MVDPARNIHSADDPFPTGGFPRRRVSKLRPPESGSVPARSDARIAGDHAHPEPWQAAPGHRTTATGGSVLPAYGKGD